MKQTKIVILGAGHVGTHCALSLMFCSLANEIVLIDTDEEKAKGVIASSAGNHAQGIRS